MTKTTTTTQNTILEKEVISKDSIVSMIENGKTAIEIQTAIDTFNQKLYDEKCSLIAFSENPFLTLYNDDTVSILSFNPNTRVLNDKQRRVKAYDIEKAYRLLKYKEVSTKDGRPLPNKDVTIFQDFKIVCALQSFIKKCNNELTKEVYTFNPKTHTEKGLKLDFSNIMDSEKALDTAINNILKLLSIQGTYKKKYNDTLKHFATKQRKSAKGITISDTSVYEIMEYIFDCCKDRVAVKMSYIQKKSQK